MAAPPSAGVSPSPVISIAVIVSSSTVSFTFTAPPKPCEEASYSPGVNVAAPAVNTVPSSMTASTMPVHFLIFIPFSLLL